MLWCQLVVCSTCKEYQWMYWCFTFLWCDTFPISNLVKWSNYLYLVSALQVIAKLTDGKATHIPYRDSKLTRLLQSSLSGHGRISVSAISL